MRQPLFLSRWLHCVGCDINVMPFLRESKRALRMMLDAKLVVANYPICKQENYNGRNTPYPLCFLSIAQQTCISCNADLIDLQADQLVNLMCSR